MSLTVKAYLRKVTQGDVTSDDVTSNGVTSKGVKSHATLKTFSGDSAVDMEIRRFSIDADVATNFSYLTTKIRTVFPDIQHKTFDLYWKDSENDLVTFSSDEELMMALGDVDDGVFNIYIDQETVPQPNSSFKNTATHQPGSNNPGPRQGLHGFNDSGLFGIPGFLFQCGLQPGTNPFSSLNSFGPTKHTSSGHHAPWDLGEICKIFKEMFDPESQCQGGCSGPESQGQDEFCGCAATNKGEEKMSKPTQSGERILTPTSAGSEDNKPEMKDGSGLKEERGNTTADKSNTSEAQSPNTNDDQHLAEVMQAIQNLGFPDADGRLLSFITAHHGDIGRALNALHSWTSVTH